MLSVTNKPFMLSVVMLYVIRLSVLMLNIIMLSVVMLNVVALFKRNSNDKGKRVLLNQPQNEPRI